MYMMMRKGAGRCLRAMISVVFGRSRFGGLLKSLVDGTYYQHSGVYFSQEGEDLVLQYIFARKADGFYVDIGAHHPKRFSNTHLLYCRGWHGINVDCIPGAMAAFAEARPRDVNLEVGVAAEGGERELYIFSEGALSTFDPGLAEQRVAAGWKLDGVRKVKVMTINSILQDHVPADTCIDVLSIDIEGLDEVVLMTLDFTRFHPTVIVCEVLTSSIEVVENSELVHFLKARGYIVFSKLVNSVVCVDSRSRLPCMGTVALATDTPDGRAYVGT